MQLRERNVLVFYLLAFLTWVLHFSLQAFIVYLQLLNQVVYDFSLQALISNQEMLNQVLIVLSVVCSFDQPLRRTVSVRVLPFSPFSLLSLGFQINSLLSKHLRTFVCS